MEGGFSKIFSESRLTASPPITDNLGGVSDLLLRGRQRAALHCASKGLHL